MTDTTPATLTTPTASALVADFLSSSPMRLLIGGEWVEAADGRTFTTTDPASGSVLAEVAAASPADVDTAVAAAASAQDSAWGRTSPAERGRLLWTLAELIERDADALAELETLDNGKPLQWARYDDLTQGVDHFRYFAGWATKLEGATIPVSVPGQHLNYTVREPVGVVGQIIPWNYPLMLAAWKLAPALAAGNSCVLKPAEQTPLSAVWLGKLIAEAGFPPGAVNILTGFGEDAGAAIASHPGIARVAFTGSTDVGRQIVHASAGNLKAVSLELGGKSPNIVFDDADLQAAITGAATAVFYNMGQDCAAGSRLFVQETVVDRVIDGLVAHAGDLRLGHGLSADADQGPLVSEEQRQRVTSYCEQAVAAGATIEIGGGPPAEEMYSAGYFFRPTVITRVENTMTVAQEEIFGPVISVIPFSSDDDAVRLANSTRYGLAAGIWTRDLGRAHRVAGRLMAGTIWVNAYNLYDSASPFGGYKQSGYGRDLGRDATEFYTQRKSIWLNLT